MLKAIIIDDEIAAVNVLRTLLEKYVKDVDVVGCATDAEKGIELINACHPHVLFLDVNMPDMDGFTLLEQVDHKHMDVVFVTAYEQYAIQAIRHHASDYILKPVDIDELKRAVEAIHTERLEEERARSFRPISYDGKLGLPVREGIIYVTISDIIRIDSDGSYSQLFTSDKKRYVVSKNIGELEELLPSRYFFRAHKSHLVNMKRVKKYLRSDGYFVEMEDGVMVELSRRKREVFFGLMNDLP